MSSSRSPKSKKAATSEPTSPRPRRIAARKSSRLLHKIIKEQKRARDGSEQQESSSSSDEEAVIPQEPEKHINSDEEMSLLCDEEVDSDSKAEKRPHRPPRVARKRRSKRVESSSDDEKSGNEEYKRKLRSRDSKSSVVEEKSSDDEPYNEESSSSSDDELPPSFSEILKLLENKKIEKIYARICPFKASFVPIDQSDVSDDEEDEGVEVEFEITEENLEREDVVYCDPCIRPGNPQYLIKFKGESFWHLQWITERLLKHVSHNLYKAYERTHPSRTEKRVLWEHINQHWFEIEEILDYDSASDSYFVKWKSLDIKESTWESGPLIETRTGKKPIEFLKSVHYYKPKRVEKNPEDFSPIQKQPGNMSSALSLYDYQLQGINWLLMKYYSSCNVILADEMGLGKTLQAIGTICELVNRKILGPFLIIAPLSTLLNWLNEFTMWAPHIHVAVLSGNDQNRTLIKKYMIHHPQDKTRMRANVVITSFELVMKDTAYLRKQKWESIIVDEGHRLKGSESKLLKILKSFDCNFKVLLTGTPLQNNLQELFTLLNYLDSDRFDDLQLFSQQIGSEESETKTKIQEMLAPHLLRRLKSDVFKDLPPKIELLVKVQMTTLQKHFYKKILAKNYKDIVNAFRKKAMKRTVSGTFKNTFIALQQCCNHPFLFFDTPEQEPKAASEEEQGLFLIKSSAKMIVLDKMLDKLLPQGHKVLIYSQKKRVLDILEDVLTYKHLKYLRIDGDTVLSDRQRYIDQFNSPDSKIPVFILSTRAGGVGINLQAADTVILYDSDWNPHQDIQAYSRSHRIGQKNTVMIYRLICAKTAEERVLQVAGNKKILEKLVVGHKALRSEECEDILKHGTKELFAEKDRDDSEQSAMIVESSIDSIGFSDKEIDLLLEMRDMVPNSLEEMEKVATEEQNTLLKSMKVSFFSVQQSFCEVGDLREFRPDETSAPAPATTQAPASSSVNKVEDDDANYWDNLLRSRIEKEEKEQTEEVTSRLRKRTRQEVKRNGKGKKQVAIEIEKSSSSDSDANDVDYAPAPSPAPSPAPTPSLPTAQSSIPGLEPDPSFAGVFPQTEAPQHPQVLFNLLGDSHLQSAPFPPLIQQDILPPPQDEYLNPILEMMQQMSNIASKHKDNGGAEKNPSSSETVFPSPTKQSTPRTLKERLLSEQKSSPSSSSSSSLPKRRRISIVNRLLGEIETQPKTAESLTVPASPSFSNALATTAPGNPATSSSSQLSEVIKPPRKKQRRSRFNKGERAAFYGLIMKFGLGPHPDDEKATSQFFYDQCQSSSETKLNKKTLEEVEQYLFQFMDAINASSPTSAQKEILGQANIEAMNKVILEMHFVYEEVATNLQTLRGDNEIRREWRSASSSYKKWSESNDLELLKAIAKHGASKWGSIVEDREGFPGLHLFLKMQCFEGSSGSSDWLKGDKLAKARRLVSSRSKKLVNVITEKKVTTAAAARRAPALSASANDMDVEEEVHPTTSNTSSVSVAIQPGVIDLSSESEEELDLNM